ncbi:MULTISPECIES: TIGR00730 family Rossman fold protein [Comamonas]|uniref:Cytokinin riboside 5'-monophosphate phosphoribohydrolase n=1 Tax=Comamonas thiooxydans TaxID=363952 RepID=A0A096CU08_9BURK|nr:MULTISPECIES: TIGR00730 family Rossman fold protein [Comamonas]KGG85040.1 lysine decarboxylase [Comamonas thiooxydans]KGG86597.1 lysine decarboxylase [Comamonas thiooxydans]KGG93722.1 lysine decarboxylase [Comamonas thiooxydans]KGG95180.1 lysine decarboxylase [Comamonas thiooxydans]KGG96792.1 lysine decarboxylase [Comamonas thiooxydans]
MQISSPLSDTDLANAWAELHNQAHNGKELEPQSNRLAFADPEFMFRRETRGIRMQLEMLKPDLTQIERGIEHTVVVYGSARFVDMEQAREQLAQAKASGDTQRMALAERGMRNAERYEAARAFARIVATEGMKQAPSERFYICTGGGPGIMEAANRGAHDAGAPNVGLNIYLPHEQHGNPYITPGLSFKFHYFALRKMHFMMRAKALVAFPGGFGTMDELFEVLTLVQTHKSKPVPVILFGTEFWKRVLNFDVLVEEGTISAKDLNLFRYTDDPAEAWSFIQQFYQTGWSNG